MEIIYNKLIRDKIPEIIKASGKASIVRKVVGDEYLKSLLNKLQEEVDEYRESKEIDELADILEIINAIVKYHNMSFNEIENIRILKKEKRGGFDQGLFLEKVIDQ